MIPLNSAHFYIGDRYTQNRTIRRNDGYTPGVFTGDISIQRNFPIHESQSFDFRAEMFISSTTHVPYNTGIPT